MTRLRRKFNDQATLARKSLKSSRKAHPVLSRRCPAHALVFLDVAAHRRHKPVCVVNRRA